MFFARIRPVSFGNMMCFVGLPLVRLCPADLLRLMITVFVVVIVVAVFPIPTRPVCLTWLGILPVCVV